MTDWGGIVGAIIAGIVISFAFIYCVYDKLCARRTEMIAPAVEPVAEPTRARVTSSSEAETTKAVGSRVEDEEPENGHRPLIKKMTSHKMVWQTMQAKVTTPVEGMCWPLALVADQDEASKTDGGWVSMVAYGKLVYNGAKGGQSYSLEMKGETPLTTDRADKSGRGAEYSALEVFDGKLLTFDDRTGNIDELVPADGFNFTVRPFVDRAGAPMKMLMGDGTKDKPLKCEWSTQKDGKLYVGSTGKERTDDDGRVMHEGEMWVKVIDPTSLAVEHVDWRKIYNGLRDAAICKPGAGYIIHEAARWSDVHEHWFFLPRKASRQPYDEVKDARKCVNLMMAAPQALQDNEGDKVHMQSYLTKTDLRGCSDFLFVPGTNDCHIFVLRTEETLDGVILTYGSVIDLTTKVLMEEVTIAENRKFEGAAWVGGFGPFPPAGPTESTLSSGA